MKAFLLSKGWKLKRTHDLEALLDEAVEHDSSLDQFRVACAAITSYYLIERYPLSVETGLTEGEVRKSLEAVRDLIERLRNAAR